MLNLSTLSASSLVPYSRSVSTTSYVVQFFSGAAHDAMYWPTVFLPLGDQETTPKKSSTQGQGTTTFTSLSCSVITCTEYNLRKRGVRHVAITLETLLHVVYIQVLDGIYPRPVTNFLMISLLVGMGGVPLTS